MWPKLGIVFTLLLFAKQKETVPTYNICAKYCYNLISEEIVCTIANNCLFQVNAGKYSFSTISGDVGLLAANYALDVYVIGEFFDEADENGSGSDIVAVVKKHLTKKKLKNCTYCVLNLENTPISYLLKFERKILEENGLDICTSDGETAIEKHISALSKFFGPSCRPGKWVEGDKYDEKLKNKYHSLQELCDVPSNESPSDKSFNRLNDKCDILLTTLNTVEKFSPNTKGQFEYLYLNENANNIPKFSWIKRPPSLLITTKENLPDLGIELKNWFKTKQHNVIQSRRHSTRKQIEFNDKQIIPLDNKVYPNSTRIQSRSYSTRKQIGLNGEQIKSLGNILFPNYTTNRLNIINPIPLKQYKSEFQFPAYKNTKPCNPEIRWCTISDEEQEKCQWFSEAALYEGIMPDISCYQKQTKFDCLVAISKSEVDIVTVNTIQFLEFSDTLEVIAVPLSTDSTNLMYLVKSNDDTFDDLPHKEGCFIFNNNGSDLDIEVALSGCFNNTSDYAIFVYRDGLKPPEDYYVMCQNGLPINYSGFANMKQNCLFAIPINLIVINKNNSIKIDIKTALSEIGAKFARENSSCQLFKEFKGRQDLLFEDGTTGFKMVGLSKDPVIENYRNLILQLDSQKTRTQNSGEHGRTMVMSLVFFCMFILIFI